MHSKKTIIRLGGIQTEVHVYADGHVSIFRCEKCGDEIDGYGYKKTPPCPRCGGWMFDHPFSPNPSVYEIYTTP
jgi:hypothetical protein